MVIPENFPNGEELKKLTVDCLAENPWLTDPKVPQANSWRQVNLTGWFKQQDSRLLTARFWGEEDSDSGLWFSMDGRLPMDKPFNKRLVLTVLINARTQLDHLRDDPRLREEAIQVGRQRWGLK